MAPLTRRQKATIASSPVVVMSNPRSARRLAAALEATMDPDGDAVPQAMQPTKRRVKQEPNGGSRSPPPKRTKQTMSKIKKESDAPNTPTNKKTKSPRRSPPRRKKTTAATARKPPKDWEQIYSLVEELRQDRSAPVDDDGGHALPQRDLGEQVWRFQVLIALMLSSQTKDAVVGDTMRSLQDYGLTMDNIAKTSPEHLNQLIGKVGFHNNKTKYIKQAVEMCVKDYNGDIPDNAQDLMKLPGVGPKMAYIIESVAFGKTTGIGVDTHMHRMYNQLGWVKSKTPEQTRTQLQSWLPQDRWATVNVLWVGFGQEVQQFKPKILRKALDCSRPKEALRLLKRLDLDIQKEGQKQGWEEEIKIVMKNGITS